MRFRRTTFAGMVAVMALVSGCAQDGRGNAGQGGKDRPFDVSGTVVDVLRTGPLSAAPGTATSPGVAPTGSPGNTGATPAPAGSPGGGGGQQTPAGTGALSLRLVDVHRSPVECAISDGATVVVVVTAGTSFDIGGSTEADDLEGETVRVRGSVLLHEEDCVLVAEGVGEADQEEAAPTATATATATGTATAAGTPEQSSPDGSPG